MTATEVALALGITTETFYRTRGRYHLEGMPAPLSKHRPWRFHRPSMQAWLGRHHPAFGVASRTALDDATHRANDNGTLDACERARAELKAEYGAEA